MTNQQRNKAIEIIANRQHTGTRSVKIQIGATWKDGGVIDHEALIILDAPAAILTRLREEGYKLSVNEYNAGVSVDKY